MSDSLAPGWLKEMGTLGDAPVLVLRGGNPKIVYVPPSEVAGLVAAGGISLVGMNLTTLDTSGLAAAPAPTLVSVAPDEATEGDGDTAITVTGTGFLHGDQLTLDGAAIVTGGTETTRTGTIPAALLAAAGTIDIGLVSANGNPTALEFTVTADE